MSAFDDQICPICGSDLAVVFGIAPLTMRCVQCGHEEQEDGNEVPNPLAMVIRDFLYIEWYEIDELAKEVRSDPPPPWLEDFRSQLNNLASLHRIPVEEINRVSGQEFDSEDAARQWLKGIQVAVFGA